MSSIHFCAKLVRKLFQTSVVGFLQADPAQLAFALLNLCVFAIIILVYLTPYKRRSDNIFALISLLLFTLIVQYSITDQTGESSEFSEAIVAMIYAELGIFCLLVLKG